MSRLRERIERQIKQNKLRMAALSGNVLREQEVGYIEEENLLLESLLKDAEPVMEQEVQVHLTLSVDARISKEDIKGRFLAAFGQQDGITTMAIDIKEEAEIYGNE